MSNQYFDNNTELESKIKTFNYYYKKITLEFSTDNGVFSKNNIDYGSNCLLQNLPDFEKVTRVLDVGCGYGPIGLTIAKKYKQVIVDMVDVNLRALSLANSNAMKNDIHNVNIFESNCYEKIDKKYDVIISNPPIRAGKKVVFEILSSAYLHLNNDGELLVVIQKKQGAESAFKLLQSVFQEVKVITKDAGYWIISSKKYGNN